MKPRDCINCGGVRERTVGSPLLVYCEYRKCRLPLCWRCWMEGHGFHHPLCREEAHALRSMRLDRKRRAMEGKGDG